MIIEALTKIPDSVEEYLVLLLDILGNIPEAALRNETFFNRILDTIFDIMKKGQPNCVLFRCIDCIGEVLEAQIPQSSFWKTPNHSNLLRKFMNLNFDEDKRVRDVAQNRVTKLLQHHTQHKCFTTSEIVKEFCLIYFTEIDKNQAMIDKAETMSKIVALLYLLHNVIYFMSPKQILEIVGVLVNTVIAWGNDKLITLVLRCIRQLVCTPNSNVNATFLIQLASGLQDVARPNANNAELSEEFCLTIAHLVCRIHLGTSAPDIGSNPITSSMKPTKKGTSSDEYVQLLVDTFHQLCSFYRSSHEVVHAAVSDAMTHMLYYGVPPHIVENALTAVEGRGNISTKSANGSATPFETIVSTLEGLTEASMYRPAWEYVFKMYEAFINVCGAESSRMLLPLIRQLAMDFDEITRIDDAIPFRMPLQRVLATCIQTWGPAHFLIVVPFKSPLDISEFLISESRVWLLPLLKENIPLCGIHSKDVRVTYAYFKDHIIPKARECRSLSQKATSDASKKTHWTQALQLWSLFPAFSSAVRDFSETIIPMGKMLTTILSKDNTTELILNIAHGLATVLERNMSVSETAGEVPLLNDPFEGDDGLFANNTNEVMESHSIGGTATNVKPEPVSFSSEMADRNLAKLKQLATNFMQPLFKCHMNLQQRVAEQDANLGRGRMEGVDIQVLKAFSLFAALADEATVGVFFDRISKSLIPILEMEKKLIADKEAGIAKNQTPAETQTYRNRRAMALALLKAMCGLIPTLSEDLKQNLCEMVAPCLKATAGLQKMAYRIFVTILANGQAPTGDFLTAYLETMCNSAGSCDAKSKRFRLMVWERLIKLLNLADEQHAAVVDSILGEAILATKDFNGRSQHGAYSVIKALGQLVYEYDVNNNDPSCPSVTALIQKHVAAFAINPTMQSGAINALCPLFYEFYDITGLHPLFVETIKTTLTLLKTNERQVVKSIYGFIKVCMYSLPEELLFADVDFPDHDTSKINTGSLLCLLATGMFSWIDLNMKRTLRHNTKRIIERMIKKFGVEIVEKLVPEEDERLLRNILRSKRRAEKKKKQQQEESKKIQEAVMEKERVDFEDFLAADNEEDEDEEMEIQTVLTAQTRGTIGTRVTLGTRYVGGRKTKRMLGHTDQGGVNGGKLRENADAPLDLLSGALRSKNIGKIVEEDDEDMGEIKYSKDGRIMIEEEDLDALRKQKKIDAIKKQKMALGNNMLRRGKKNRKRKRDDDDDDEAPKKKKKSSNALAPYAYIPIGQVTRMDHQETLGKVVRSGRRAKKRSS
eukprot:TRINITY_DN7025_c0_g1_i1.p1 TRINITY_DN7025_c0_g1~~TRINITY_DN7025_c0_g1_i1.p1  ORF type:complete len:1340 (+),score=518.35 TRINITY_DN7025_c0_g1_i1:184-4020(+)